MSFETSPTTPNHLHANSRPASDSHLVGEHSNTAAAAESALADDHYDSAARTRFETLVIATSEAPPAVFDAGMKKNGEYLPAYQAFVETTSGRQFIERFSDIPNGSTLECLDGCKGGNMQGHSLTFRTQAPQNLLAEGMTRVYLVSRGRNVPLEKVKASDVSNQELHFSFFIEMPTSVANDKEHGAVTLGHEVFVHAQGYANDLSALLTEIEGGDLTAGEIVDRIHTLKAKHGKWGKHDHRVYKAGENNAVSQYYDELIANARDVSEADAYKRHIADDLAKW